MSLHTMCSGDELQRIGDLSGVHKGTSSKIVRIFCKAIRKHL